MSDHSPPYRFCPCCGGPLASRQLKDGDPPRLVCTACGHVFYLDPKVAVGTIIRMPAPDGTGEGIVLLRRAIDPGYGRWVFPGGYVDRGEPVVDAALREAREECRLEVRLDGLVGVYSYPGRTPVVIVYAASVVSGTLEPDEESLEAQVFSEAAVPWADLAFPSTRDALRDYFAGQRLPLRKPEERAPR